MKLSAPLAGLLAALSAALLTAIAPAGGEDFAARAARLQRESIVVDSHEDVPWELYRKWVDLGKPGATKDVDIPRLVKGASRRRSSRSTCHPTARRGGPQRKETLEIIDVVDRVVASHPEILVSASSVAEIRAAKKAGRSRS